MKNKKILCVLTLLFILSILIGCTYVVSENNKLAKFAITYILIDKSKTEFLPSDNVVNSCLFTKSKLKNNVELQCKELKQFCIDKIPLDKKDINTNTACAIITVDINGFDNKPNQISDKKNISDQYQILTYKDGITTIPASMEDELLNSTHHSLKARLRELSYIWEISKNIDSFRAIKKYQK